MSVQDRAFAELSGIAVGWVYEQQDRRAFRCACLLCELRLDRPADRTAPPQEVAYQAIVDFIILVAKQRCEHWEKYQDMRNDPDFLESEDMQATMASLRRGARPRARRTRCRES